MRLDWRWIFFQVGIPAILPIFLSALFVLCWMTLSPDFTPDFRVVIDVTPWAIAVYSLTLIGGAFDRSRKLDLAHTLQLCGAATANAVYYSMLVIKRHDPHFVVTWSAYSVTLVLMFCSIVICYRAR